MQSVFRCDEACCFFGQVHTTLEVDVEPDVSWHKIECLPKRWNLLSLKPAVFPGTGIQFFQVNEQPFLRQAAAVGCSVNRAIVHEHEFPILGGGHVELDHLRAQPDGLTKRSDRVFRMSITRTSVCTDTTCWHLHVFNPGRLPDTGTPCQQRD